MSHDDDVAWLKSQNVMLDERSIALFDQIQDLEDERDKMVDELEESGNVITSLISEMADYKAGANEVNLDALSEAFATMNTGETQLGPVCDAQALQLANEFDRVFDVRDGVPLSVRMKLDEVVGTRYVQASTCDLVKDILSERGWDAKVSLEGMEKTRTMLVIAQKR